MGENESKSEGFSINGHGPGHDELGWKTGEKRKTATSRWRNAPIPQLLPQ